MSGLDSSVPVGEFPKWVTIDSGPQKGCSRIDWGGNWGAAVGILILVYFVLIPSAVLLSSRGYNKVGMFLYPTLFILGITVVGVPWCGLDAVLTGSTVAMIFNILIAGLFVLAAVVNSSSICLKRYSPLGRLMNTRVGKPISSPWANTDLFLIGPVNEFLSLSVMEVIGMSIILAWLSVCVWARYRDLMDTTWGFEYYIGNKSRAFGRAMSAATLRLLLLTFVSSSRNTIINYFLGIPFERAVKWHKMLGRLQVVCMWIHMAAMLYGGTEVGYTWYTKSRNALVQVQWGNSLNMYGSGTNLFAGPIALFFWTMLLLLSMPYFRRKMLETFYFTHINLFFAANIFTVFHARAQVIPYLIPAALLFYIDASIRVVAKMTAVTPVELKVIGDNMVKLVLRQTGFPLPFFKFHAGSYIWLSCNMRKKLTADGSPVAPTATPSAVTVTPQGDGDGKYTSVADDAVKADQIELEGIFSAIKVPGGPPSGLPSWIWFHPITVASYDEATGAITLFIKAFGEGKTEWSGQLLAAAKLVESGHVTLDDIGFHIGGPNGDLMIKEPLESLDQVVMVSGGIGCTPMVAILEDLVKKKFAGKVDFIWSTRSSSELDCFRELFAKCAPFDKFNVQVFFTGKIDAENASMPVAGPGFHITTGRPDLAKLIEVQGKDTCGVLCCGPEALMYAVEGIAVDGQRAGKNILFHRETFEF